jgi:hypothetical protein
MAKKQTPVWKMLGIPEPEIVKGYWSYGTVWHVDTHRPPTWWENQRDSLTAAWLSYRMWGRKIRKQIRWEITQRREARR